MNPPQIDCHIWSDTIPINAIREWYDYVTEHVHWTYGGQSGDKREPYRIWNHELPPHSMQIFTDDCMERTGLEDCMFEIWEILKRHTDTLVPGLIPCKVLINAFSFGDSSWIHRDSDSPDEPVYTCNIYLNPFWDMNWGGETVIINDARDTILHSIYPKAGRIVLFDGRKLHGARPLSREAPMPRVSITFQCQLSTPHPQCRVHGVTFSEV